MIARLKDLYSSTSRRNEISDPFPMDRRYFINAKQFSVLERRK